MGRVWTFGLPKGILALFAGGGRRHMRGTVYGVGVGPGDPELMTLKAARRIREADVIAVPGRVPEASVAYRIAAAAVPEIAGKALLGLDMPMTRERAALEEAHRAAARRIETRLERGENVAYLTLGDPAVYCTFSYLQRILEADGFRAELVSGVPAFCAAAARLNLPLAEWDEPLHILPSGHGPTLGLDLPGTCVLMKSASRMAEVKEALRASGRRVWMVENCGMADERALEGVESIPDDAGYFSLIIAKKPSQG